MAGVAIVAHIVVQTNSNKLCKEHICCRYDAIQICKENKRLRQEPEMEEAFSSLSHLFEERKGAGKGEEASHHILDH